MKNPTRPILILTLLTAAFVAFKYFDLAEYLTLDYLKSQQEALSDYYNAHQTTVLATYFILYVLVTALSIPGALVMTLAAGALFGTLTGTLIVSFASTLGATLAALIARTLLRNFIQNKYSQKLKPINTGIEKEGPFYLFAIRLVPIFPFFIVNLLMGITKMPLTQFFWVSQLGMLPGTIAFVNAGTQLAKINSLSGILSPQILLAFALLGIIPLLSKALINFLRSNAKMKGFKKPKHFDYNLVVIGAGSGGLVSSYIAATIKAKVALIEKHKMGGDCLNTGCVPSKALIKTAKVLAIANNAQKYGLHSLSPKFDFKTVMDRVHNIIKKIEPHDSPERYSKLGVDCIQDTATITSPYHIKLNSGKTLTTKNIIIATGGKPITPNIPGIEHTKHYTSDTLWSLQELPPKLLVIGSGPIGCELAQCFARLGSQVTLLHRGSRILEKEDPDMAKLVENSLLQDNIKILHNHNPIKFQDPNHLIAEHQGTQHTYEFTHTLLAVGRSPNTTGFGLENINAEIEPNGGIAVDSHLRLKGFSNIYAVGDVINHYQFTHTASHQAWFATVNALFSPLAKFQADYSTIPWCTFTDPEIAHVGLTEKQLKEQNTPYDTTTYNLNDLDRAIADSEDYGLVKVLTPKDSDKILGATIVGSHAGDIISEFVLAKKHNLGLNKILGTIHIYPTHAEANKFAAGNWKKAHTPHKLLNWVQKFHRLRR